MRRRECVYQCLQQLCARQQEAGQPEVGASAAVIAAELNMHRANVSADLNELHRLGRLDKIPGKPVLYCSRLLKKAEPGGADDVFARIIGSDGSLKQAVQQAKAAILYPPRGLHTLLYGETGTGKSYFAEIMYEYARTVLHLAADAPFVAFNCADYASNPELLMAQLFGVKKGAYTGADRDRAGIVERADGGILFLDEVHRLPPEGQEMLFYLIDKGIYKRLGETEQEQAAEVLIIAATTEALSSTLLRTFLRRIPMVLELPPLSERSLAERYALIVNALQQEAGCIKGEIEVSPKVFKALLLYECVNNIGQLKSDIKLCCAKAFLEQRLGRRAKLVIQVEDVPRHVIQGLLRYKEKQQAVDELLQAGELRVRPGGPLLLGRQAEKPEYNLYEVLAEKQRLLAAQGVPPSEMDWRMSLDLEGYFKQYVRHVGAQNWDDLYKVVERPIVHLVDEFLQFAGSALARQFARKHVYALALHVAKSVERLQSGGTIVNQQLPAIKEHHPEAFAIAGRLAQSMEQRWNIRVPEAEIGFLTLFLCLEEELGNNTQRVGVIVAMHGESAATSLADVANRLVGETHAVGYNMSLEQKTETALEELAQLVKQVDQGRGVLLLVDMGSLALLGDILYARSQVLVKTVEMVSTPVVIEAARKALQGASLEEVYQSCWQLSPFLGRAYRDSGLTAVLQPYVVVTACITGKGTAVKMKQILEQQLAHEHCDIDIMPVEVESRRQFQQLIASLAARKRVLAVISALAPAREPIWHIPVDEFLQPVMLTGISQTLSGLKRIYNMEAVIREHITLDASSYITGFCTFYLALRQAQVLCAEQTLIGLLLHIAYALERLQQGLPVKTVREWPQLAAAYAGPMRIVEQALAPLAQRFSVTVPPAECASIVKMLWCL